MSAMETAGVREESTRPESSTLRSIHSLSPV